MKVKGTIGILIMGYENGHIIDIKTELDDIRKRGFWLAEDVYQSILRWVDRK